MIEFLRIKARTPDQLAGTFTMPTNVKAAYLDVFAQGQQDDEFWYTCAPNDVAGELDNCGNSSFREAEVTIDGTKVSVPAGTLLVEAGRRAGVEIPVFCHHEKLKPVGACRNVS